VLAFDKEELKSGIREASVKKAPFDNQKVRENMNEPLWGLGESAAHFGH